MLLMIDNYDSFTYNLVQYFRELGEEVVVYRNDAIDLHAIEELNPRKIVISPGPCSPREAGISVDTIRYFAGKVPLFGVCLGHQSIAEAFGGTIVRAHELMHGKTSEIYHEDSDLFSGLESPFIATRYHSLVVEKASFPAQLNVTAWTQDQMIMGLAHRDLPIWGVQFHPESILSVSGKELMANFLRLADKFWSDHD
ncbi:MAG: anthranilate/aminodeoxychorismate synthase component II [Desulfuromonadales bacterium C00003068]|jgi:anthranilate synthase component 2|nr:aminodeoxychorismate/anthranilate synthase component II [Deltaproteobacteria bacterium]OEU75064.1 MAG: anthranilate/aminodeoxychorismate synthase component II [Desulfuromonadales bacterium C00003068]